MAKITQLVCPSCGGQLKISKGSSETICEYCGKRVAFGGPTEGALTPKCPACGGSLRFDPSSGQLFCDSCSSSFVIDDGSDDLKNGMAPAAPDYIIPFSLTIEEVRPSFVRWLGKRECTPGDLYEAVKIEGVKGAYVPFYLYTCEYKANYECSALIETAPQKKAWQRRSGVVSGTCESNVEVSEEWRGYFNAMLDQIKANKSVSDHPQVRDLLSENDAAKTRKAFDAHYAVGIEAAEFDRSPRDAWPSAEYMADRAIEAAVNSQNRAECKDMTFNPKRVNWRCKSYWVPIWVIRYSYRGRPFTYMKIADDAGYEFGSRPYDPRSDALDWWLLTRVMLALAEFILIVAKIADGFLGFIPSSFNRYVWYAIGGLIPTIAAMSFGARIAAKWHRSRANKNREKGMARVLSNIASLFG